MKLAFLSLTLSALAVSSCHAKKASINIEDKLSNGIILAEKLAEFENEAFASGTHDTTNRMLKMKKMRPKRANETKIPLDPANIPKYVTDLWIMPVLHDDDQANSIPFDVSVRQIQQQMLPQPYPKTTIWAYGKPKDHKSFHYPTGTIEVTKNKETTVNWINELVKNPTVCNKARNGGGKVKSKKGSTACNYLSPLIGNNQSYHWANPPQNCADGAIKTDCMGPDGLDLYNGPVPMITHVHGAHTPPEYDGYAESWWLPKADNIPKGYKAVGSYYDGPRSPLTPGRRKVFSAVASSSDNNPGYGRFQYPNDQETTTLWFHDHTLGMSLENVYSMGYGYWLIRTKDNGEDGLSAFDCKNEPQNLPGPPPLIGQDPNADRNTRCKIREIPLSFQMRSYYDDGSIYLRPGGKDLEFDMMTVNGNTWPKLVVDKDRYRFRLLNACGLREVLGLFMIYTNSNDEQIDVPFYVIGSDQGMLPKVAIVTHYSATVIEDCGGTGTPKDITSGLLISPGERYDVLVDFSDLPDGTVVQLKNSKSDTYDVMRFIVNANLCGDGSGEIRIGSTSPYDLKLNPRNNFGPLTNDTPRDLSLTVNKEDAVLVGVQARLNGSSLGKLWSDPITENPEADAIELWVRIEDYVGAVHLPIFLILTISVTFFFMKMFAGVLEFFPISSSSYACASCQV